MQKTLTVKGRKYTGKQIADLMDASTITNDLGDNFITLGNVEFACQYRHDDHDGIFAPHVMSRARANCIKMECMSHYMAPVWIEL